MPVRLCAVFLTALQLLSSVPPAAAAPVIPVPASVRTFSNLSAIRIPETLGHISEFHQGAGPEKFILVQDAHAIGETQQNIARILQRLELKYGVLNFAVEGGEGAMDPLMLETTPARKALENELGQMIQAGELSGTVPAAMPGRTRFWGIEDSGLYEKEIHLYVQNLSGKTSVLEKIQRARAALQTRKKKVYPEAALKLDRWLSSFNREPLQNPALMRKILKLGPPDPKRYPGLDEILRRPVRSPAATDGKVLLGAHKEWDVFVRELYDNLLKTKEQKNLRQLSESLDRLESFAGIRLSAADWRILQAQGIEKTLGAFPGLTSSDFDLARQFYETARQRDQVFLQRLWSLSPSAQGGPVVFVSGGFHADGLRAELRHRGASYLVISPHFSETLNVKRYDGLMRGGQSWNRGNKSGALQEFTAFHAYLLERLFPQMTLAQIKTWRDEILRRLAREGRLDEAGFYTGIFDASLRKFLNSEDAGGLLADAGKRLDSFLRGLSALQKKNGLVPADLLPLFQQHTVSPHDKPLIRHGWRINGLGLPNIFRSEMPLTRRSWTSRVSPLPDGRDKTVRAAAGGMSVSPEARSEMRTADTPALTYKEALERFKQGDYDGAKGLDAWEKTPVEVRKRFVLNLAKLKTQKLRAEVSASQRERAERLQITLPQQGFKFETQAHQLVRVDFSGEHALKLDAKTGKTLESLYEFYEEKLKARGEEDGDGAGHADHVINFMLHDLGLDRVERIRQWGRNVPEEKKIEKVTEFLEFLLTHEWDASTITFQPLDFERSVYDLLAHHARFFRSKWVVSHMNKRHFSKYGIQAELGFLTSFFAKGKLGTQFYPYLEIASVILALRKSEDFRREMNAEDFNVKTWNQSPADLQKTAARAREILNNSKIRRQTLQTGAAARDLGTQDQQDFRRRHGIILGADLTQRIYSNLFRDDLEQVFYFQHVLGRAYQELEHMEILRVLRDELAEVKDRDIFLHAGNAAQPDYRIRLNALRQVEEVWTLHKNETGAVIFEDRHVLLKGNYAWPDEMPYEKFADLVGKKRGLYSALITQRVFSEHGAPALRVEIENSEAGTAQVTGLQTYVRQTDGVEQVLVPMLYRQDSEFNPHWTLADWRARAGDRQVPPPSLAENGELPTEWARSKSFKIGDNKQKGLSAEIVYFKADAAVETVEDSTAGREISVVTLGEIERITRSVFGPSDDEFYEDEHLLPGNAASFLYALQDVTGSSQVRKPEAEEKEEFWAQHSGLFSEHFKSRTFFEVSGEFENPALKIELDPRTGKVFKILRFKHDENGKLVSQDVWTPRQTLGISLRSTDPGVLYQTSPGDAAPDRPENWNLETWRARLSTIAVHSQRIWFDSNGVEQLSLDLSPAAVSEGAESSVGLMITGARLLSGTGQRPVFTIHPDLLRAVPFQPRKDLNGWREKLEPLLPLFSASGRTLPAAEGLEMLETAARKTVWAAYHDPKLLAAKVQAVRTKISHERDLLELALETYQTYLETGHITASATHELRDFIENRIDPALEKWVGPLEGSLSDSWHTVLPRHMAFLMQSEIQRQLKFSDDKLAIIKLFLRPIAASALTPAEAVQFAKLMTAAEPESDAAEAVEEAEEGTTTEMPKLVQPLNTLADKLRWALETVSLTEGIYKEHLALLRMLGVDMKQYAQYLADLSPAKTPEFLAGQLEKNLFSLKTKGWLSALWTLDYVRHLALPVARAYDAGSFLFPAAQAKPGMLSAPAEILDGEDHPVLTHLRANSDSPRWNPAPVLKPEDASADKTRQGKYQLVTSFFRLQSQTPEQIAAFLKSAHSLLQTGGHVLITLPAQLVLENAGLAQVKDLGFNIKQGFASNRLQDAAREILLKGRSNAGELDAAARAEAGIYGRGFYVLDLEKTAEAPALNAPFDQLVFTNWHHDVLVRDENPRTASERVLVSDDREQARVLAKIRPQDLEFVPLQEHLPATLGGLLEATAEQRRIRMAYHTRILNLVHRYRHLLLVRVKDSRRNSILQLFGAFYEDAPSPRENLTETSPANFWNQPRENPESIWSESHFAAAKSAYDTLLNEYVIMGLYPAGTQSPGFDYENLFSDRWAKLLLKKYNQRFADDTYLFEDEALRVRVPVIYAKWRKAEEPLTEEEIEVWSSLRAAMREFHEVLAQIELGQRGLRSQKILESGFSPSLGRDPYDFSAALAAEQILKDVDQHPGGAYFDMFSGKGVLMHALHDLQESRPAAARRVPNGVDFTLYQADPNAEDLTVTPPGDWDKAAGLVRIEAGLDGLPKGIARLDLASKIRILTLINVLHRMNPAEARRFFLQAAELLQNGGRLLLTLPNGMEMSASMREALFKMGFELSPPRRGVAQISEPWLDQVEQRVLETYGDVQLARRVRANVKSTSRRRFSMIELTLDHDRYHSAQLENLSQENFTLERPVRRKKSADDPQAALPPAVPSARPDVLRTRREVLDALHKSDAGGRFQVKALPESQLVDRAEAQNLFPEIQSENALEHLYRNRAFFSDPARANEAVRLIEENYDYWRFGTRQFRAGDMQRLRKLYVQGPEAPRKANRLFTKEELLGLAVGRREPPFDSLRDKLEKQLPKIQDFEVLAFAPGAYAGKAPALSVPVPESAEPSLLHLLQRASAVQPVWSVQRLAALEQFLIQRQAQPGIRRVTELLRKPPRPVVSRVGAPWTNEAVWAQALEMRATPWQAYLAALQSTDWAAPALEHLLPFSLYIASLYQLIRDHPERGEHGMVILPDGEYLRAFAQLAALNHLNPEEFTQRLQTFSGSFWIDLQKLPPGIQDLIEKINDLEVEESGREQQQKEGAELGAALHQDYLQIRAFMTGFLSEQTQGFGDYGVKLMAFAGSNPERLALLEAVLDDVLMSGEYAVERMHDLQKTVESQYLALVYNNPDLAFKVIQRMSVLTGSGNLAFGERTHLAAFAAARLSEFFDRFGIRAAVKQAFPGQDPEIFLARLITNGHLRKFMDTGKERAAPEGSELLEEMSRLMRDYISNAQAPAGAEHAGLLNQMAVVKGAPQAFIESLIESRVPVNAPDQTRYFEQIQIYLKKALLAAANLEDFYALASRLARHAPALYAHARPLFLTWLNFYFHSQAHRHEFVQMLSELNETRVRDWAAILGFNPMKAEDFVNLNEFKYIEEAILEAIVSDHPVAAYQAARLVIVYEQGTRPVEGASGARHPQARQFLRMIYEELYRRHGVDILSRMRLLAGFISEPQQDFVDFALALQNGILKGLEEGSFRHVFYPKIERFFKVWSVRAVSERPVAAQPPIFADLIQKNDTRREQYSAILSAEENRIGRYHGRQAVTTWLRGHMYGFDREKGRFPNTAAELVNWAAGTSPSFPLEQFPGHMLGGDPSVNPLMGVVEDAFRGFFELNRAIDEDMQHLGSRLAHENPESKLYPNFWVWLKDPMQERQEIAMGATYAAIKPDGEAVIYIYTKDHPDPVISSHDPYFYRREVQDLLMALGHLTHDEAFVKRQGFKKARFVLLLEGMDFLRKDPPPLPEGVSLEWVSDLPAAPPSPVRVEANFYDPKTRRYVSGSELGSADYKLADVAQRMQDAYTARRRAFVDASGPKPADEQISTTPLAKLDDRVLNDMSMIQWTFGEKPGTRRPPLWTLDAEERAAIESFVRKILEAPTREERGLWGNLLELIRRKGFAANSYARFYFAHFVLSGAYAPEAIAQGMRSLDHIFLGYDFYAPAGTFIEQLLALQDAISDTALPEELRLMLQGYFAFLFSHHASKTTFEAWAEKRPGNQAFGEYLTLRLGVPSGIRGDATQTQLLELMVAVIRDPADKSAAQKIRDILKSPTYQQAIIPLLVQYSEKTAHAPRGIAPKMTESKIRPVTQIMFEPSVPFKVLIDYFHYAQGIYAVWHKQYDYDSSVMRWFLGDLWGEIERRLGTGEVGEEEFIDSVFGHFWTQDTLIQLMGPEPVVLSRFDNVRRIILEAMTGPDQVLSGRAFNFVSQLQQQKAKEKNEGKLLRHLDGDDLLLRDAFVGLFRREGISALAFQLAYSLAPDSSHVRSIFFHAADVFIASQPASEQPVLIARFFRKAEDLLALTGITDFSTMQDAVETLKDSQKRAGSGKAEIPFDSFSPELRARVQGLVRDIFEAPMKQVQQQLAAQLKQLTERGPQTVYAEFETSLAVMRQRLLGAGRTIEQIETAQMLLFQAGLDPQTTVLQRLTPEELQKLEAEFYAGRAGRSEDELRDAALAFYYFSLLAGRPYKEGKDRRAEYPLQNQFAGDLSLMQAAISEIQDAMRHGNILETAGGLYQKIIAHYGFQNLEAMKTILHYLRVTHDEEWAELFLKTLETAIRAALEAGETLNAAEINGWIMAELANHNWPRRRVLQILGTDAEGGTRFDRLFPKTVPAPEPVKPVAPVLKPRPAEPPAWEPPPAEDEEPAPEPEGAEDNADEESEDEPRVLITPPAPKPTKLKPVEPSKRDRAAVVRSQFDEILMKTPDEFKSLARSPQEGVGSIAEEFGRAVGFLLFSQAPGAGDEAALAKRFRAFELALRHFDTVLSRLDDFEMPELFDQIWSKIPSGHPGAWFREETLSPERMLELEGLTFGSLQSIPDFFDYLAYDRSRPESHLRSGNHTPLTRLEELLGTPENRQAFREKMRSNYFVSGVWTSPFLFSEELKVFDQNNTEFRNIRETFLEMARERDPRTTFFIHDGLLTLHRNRQTNLLPDQPADIKEGLRRFHADFLAASGYLAYFETRTHAAAEGNAGAQEFVRSFFTPQILSVIRYASQQQTGPVFEQIRQILLVLQRQLPADAGGDMAHKILSEMAKKRSEMRLATDVAMESLLFERMPENGMLEALLRVVRDGRVSQLAAEITASLSGGLKARLLDRLITAPAGLEAVRPAGLSVPAQPVVSDTPLVWISSKLPELAAIKTFARESPAAHVLILLLPAQGAGRSIRVDHFTSAEFPQIKIAAPKSREAFRRVLHNVPAEFGRTFSAEPVFILNSEVEKRLELEDITLVAEKALEYSASWQGSAFLPHHYLLLLDAAKLSQDLELAYGQRENSAKRWYLFDERRVNTAFLADLGKFLSAQVSFTASA